MAVLTFPGVAPYHLAFLTNFLEKFPPPSPPHYIHSLCLYSSIYALPEIAYLSIVILQYTTHTHKHMNTQLKSVTVGFWFILFSTYISWT